MPTSQQAIYRGVFKWIILGWIFSWRSNDVKVLKSRWNFVKTKTTTPGNNIYTLVITFTALFRLFHLSFISHTNSLFPIQTLILRLGHMWFDRQRSSSNQLSAASVLIQQNQHGDMASFAEALYKAPTKSERNLFFCEGRCFNSHSEQCSNTCTHVCMAVLVRCVTCKRLFYFWRQRKVLSCEIYLPALRPCFFHGGALVFFWTATKSLTFLNNFQVNLHFTRYAQGT